MRQDLRQPQSNVRYQSFQRVPAGLCTHQHNSRHRRRGSKPLVTTAESRGISAEATQPVEWISYAPAEEITSSAARACLASLQRCPIDVPELGRTVQTAYLCTNGDKGADPILLLPGFDSSCLEMRELLPRLQAINAEAWAVDMVGWGFSDAGLADSSASNPIALGPAERRAHLHAFWREKIRRPMLVVGTSLGAASAVDFATAHPEAVRKLAIIDGQAFVDGLGPVAKLPPWLAGLGVQVLRSKWLRRSAGKQSYFDKGMATEEAMLIGRLHTWQPGWSNGMVSFMRSGGYSVAAQVPKIQQETLVIWGRNDQILDPKLAEQFKSAIPKCTLAWIEECGHCAHVEKPDEAARLLLEFASVDKADKAVLEQQGAVSAV